MRYEITSSPALDALSLAHVKEHLRLTHADDDAALTRLIKAVTDYFENTYSMALINQTITLWMHNWPAGSKSPWWDGQCDGAVDDMLGTSHSVILPIRPLITVQSVSMVDDELKETLWDASHYRLSGGLEPRLIKKDGVSWPIPKSQFESIKIVYQAGFGATAEDIPMLIAHGMKEMIAHLYMYRGDNLDISAKRSGAQSLWNPYKRVRL